MASQDWLEKDFYKILGVAADVSDKDLTKKYHKLAHKYHPDSNPGNTAAEAKFKEISEAYSVLSDKDQRAEYDQIRAMGSGGARFTAGGAGFEDIFGGFGGSGAGNFRSGHGFGGGFEDIFSMFGGGSAPGGFGQHFAPAAGKDVTAAVTIDFKTAITGDQITVNTHKGAVKVRVPAGVSDGKKIRVRGKGEPSPNGGSAGDLLVTVTVRKHPVFERDGKNLRVKLPVTFIEASLGATVEVPTLEDGVVKLKIAPGTPSGRQLRLKGRGIKTKTGTGDLLAEVQIVVPQELNEQQRQLLEEYAQITEAENPRVDLLARAQG